MNRLPFPEKPLQVEKPYRRLEKNSQSSNNFVNINFLTDTRRRGPLWLEKKNH